MSKTERATFAAGCFWGVEAASSGPYRELCRPRLVTPAMHTTDPTYRRVCGHRTGHAEAVEVWFDPARVTYPQLLETFWRIHNPTTRTARASTWQSVPLGNLHP